MNFDIYFKSIIDEDNCNVVICDLNHTIIYMNPSAIKSYSKYGNLIGKSLLNCHNMDSNNKIIEVVEWFKRNVNNNRVHTFFNEKQNKDVYMVALRDENKNLIGYYEKHEFRNKDLSGFYDLKKE